MEVPFVDLKAQYRNIRTRIDASIRDVIESASFIMGPHVEGFEKAFAEMNGAAYCIGTSSGTDALHLALWAHGITTGDRVLLPVNTFIATAEAVSLCGARPVFVDCDDHFNMDAAATEALLGNGPPVSAVVPVHLYGQPADMGAILDAAAWHGVPVIEDACQAHLATWADAKGTWRAAGSAGSAGAFSFFPGKNLGAYGEAGAVLTSDPVLYQRMLHLHNHGSTIRYEHTLSGHNYRMEAIQGAVLSVKLDYIAGWTKMRRENAALYDALLSDVAEVTTPATAPGRTHSFHLYVIRVKDGHRDYLAWYLKGHGVATGLHYPTALHLQRAYAHLGYKEGHFPKAEGFAREILSLPMYPELTPEQIGYVADTVKGFFAGRGNA
jgi:dTDP-4-amino-4,6-dideoxygalactose transaminase